MFANNKISTIVESQLPDFIRSDHPEFVTFIKKYYEYLEQTDKAVYTNKKLYDYADVDLTKSTLLKYFKEKIIPDFPEETELSKEKIIKAARSFYSKKGTPDSFKFLFKILYGQDIDVYFPKEDILKASDGKWKLPQALRISLNDKLTLVPTGNVNVFVTIANTVNANGFNLVTAGVTVNSYLKIGDQRRKVLFVNNKGDFANTDVPFINSTNHPTQIFDTQNLYKVELNEYTDLDFNLLERRKGVGELSKTTCIIESAVKTIDKDTGREIVELYVSNVKKPFETNENIVVEYDDNGTSKVFKSKIISLISNIKLFKNRFGVVQSGKNYKIGDPVTIFGGLNTDSPDAVQAEASVKEVTLGDIEYVKLENGGYFFRDTPNSLVTVYSSSGIGANVLIDAIWEDSSNSELFSFNTDSLMRKYETKLDNSVVGYSFENVATDINFTVGAGNTVSAVNLYSTTYTPSSINDYYNTFVLKIIGGTGEAATPNSAIISGYNGTTKIATLATPLGIAPSGTSKIRLFANGSTQIGRALSFETMRLGKIRFITLPERGSNFEAPPTFNAISVYDSDYSADANYLVIPSGQFKEYNKTNKTIKLNETNTNYSKANGYYTGARLFVDVGKTSHYANIIDYVVNDVDLPTMTKTLYLDRTFDSNIDAATILNMTLLVDFRPDVRGMGKIGAIEVLTQGSGYSATDVISFVGPGYGAVATPVIQSGKITKVNITNRGEGYFTPPEIVIRNSSGGTSTGSGATFKLYTLSDGELFTANVSDIGAIKTFDVSNRGFDYESTPKVSLKIVDFAVVGLLPGVVILAGDTVWQGGVTNADATFSGVIDGIHRGTSNTIIRVFDYNGTITSPGTLRINTATQNIVATLSTATESISYKGINPAVPRAYPYIYGNGLAKANAEFLSGLIKYDGFYLNTDGHISSDKKIQNKDYYHNFSYEIQSETPLSDYKETVYRAAHPAGMQLLSKYLIKGDLNDKIRISSSNIMLSNTTSSTNANTNFSSNIVYGNSSLWLTTVNVGDILIINSGATQEGRKFSRVVTQIQDNDILRIESPVGSLGDGKIAVNTGSINAIIVANNNPISTTLAVSDNIRFNVAMTEFDRQIVSIAQNNLVLNAAVSVTGNGLYKTIPTFNVVDYEIISFRGAG
jgi:ribosomal protein S17E